MQEIGFHWLLVVEDKFTHFKIDLVQLLFVFRHHVFKVEVLLDCGVLHLPHVFLEQLLVSCDQFQFLVDVAVHLVLLRLQHLVLVPFLLEHRQTVLALFYFSRQVLYQVLIQLSRLINYYFFHQLNEFHRCLVIAPMIF